MIIEDYCDFEISKLLNENGFSSNDCHTAYDENGEFFWYGDYSKDRRGVINAPTIQQAMKWLREVHGIIPIILTGDSTQNPLYYWFRIDRVINGKLEYAIYREGELEFTTYEEACEAAIEYCLKNLVK